MRLLQCLACSGHTTDKDGNFPDEHKRWAYYVLNTMMHPTIRQPSGLWCWECDSLCEHQPEDKDTLKGKLGSDPEYRRVWTEEWLPRQRVMIAAAISRGDDRLPRQSKRACFHEEGQEQRVFVPGIWIESKKYIKRFPERAQRTHRSQTITNPETKQLWKAYFIPDNDSGVWRGEHGSASRTMDRTRLATDQHDPTRESMEKFMAQHALAAPKVIGKTGKQFEEEKGVEDDDDGATSVLSGATGGRKRVTTGFGAAGNDDDEDEEDALAAGSARLQRSLRGGSAASKRARTESAAPHVPPKSWGGPFAAGAARAVATPAGAAPPPSKTARAPGARTTARTSSRSSRARATSAPIISSASACG